MASRRQAVACSGKPGRSPGATTDNNNPNTQLSRTYRPDSLVTHPKQFVVSWLVVILTLPITFPLLLAIYSLRWCVRLLASRTPNLLDPLTPYDCIFAVDSYHTRPYASNLTVLELTTRLDIDTLRDAFKSRILDQPQFSKLGCVPVEFLGWWFWKKLDHVDVLQAVRVFHDSELEEEPDGLARSGSNKSMDECLREIVEMPYGNELFNVLLLHFGNKSVVVFRIHHTVCDGYSFNKLIDTFVGLESRYLVKCTEADDMRKRGPVHAAVTALNELIRIAYLLVHLPMRVATLYKESLNHTPNFYTLPKSSTTGTIRRTILPLQKVKHVRSATDSHFASIGMSLMTGALQRFYDNHDPRAGCGNPRGGVKPTESLRPTRLAIMHSLPKPNHPLSSLCNHWGVGLFKIPFVRDPVDRMYGSEGDFNEYLDLQFDRILHMHIPIVGLVPASVVKWFFSINFGTSCGFTSVPGLFDKIAYVGGNRRRADHARSSVIDDWESGVSRVPDPSAGVEVKHMWKVFGLQWRQSAVAVAMYTYRGEASVSIYANKDIIPDDASMDRLIQLFHEEFDELVDHSNKNSHEDRGCGTPQVRPDERTKPAQDGSVISGLNCKTDGVCSTTTARFIDAWFRNNKLA